MTLREEIMEELHDMDNTIESLTDGLGGPDYADGKLDYEEGYRDALQWVIDVMNRRNV